MRRKSRKILFVKKHANHIHFKRRLLSRYGLTINSSEHKELVAWMKLNKSKISIFPSTLSRNIVLLSFKGVEILALYDKGQNNFVTALPIEKKLRYFPEKESQITLNIAL